MSTAEQQYRYARISGPVSRRALASWMDLAAVVGLYLLLRLGPVNLGGLVGLVVMFVAYKALFEGFLGRTPGKMVMGLYVGRGSERETTDSTGRVVRVESIESPSPPGLVLGAWRSLATLVFDLMPLMVVVPLGGDYRLISDRLLEVGVWRWADTPATVEAKRREAERERRQRQGVGAPGGTAAASPDEGRRERNVAGAKGEAKVNEVLSSLSRQGHHCYVFSDLPEEGLGNIDHLVVCKTAAIVVETKANRGEVVLHEDGRLTYDGQPFPRDPFEQAASGLRAIHQRIGLPYGNSFVCLVGASSVERSSGAPDGWRLLTLGELAGRISSLPANLSEAEVDRLAEEVMGHYGAAPIASPPTTAGSGP